MTTLNLTHHFLVAMPAMQDEVFAGALVYVCQHDDNGAIGIVVNRVLDISLQDLFSQLDLTVPNTLAHKPVLFGGPVQPERGVVLHAAGSGDWASTLAGNPDLHLTTSRDVLQANSVGQGPSELLVALGYAGWEPNQLEDELKQNAWLTLPADSRILFEYSAKDRYDAALRLLGVDRAFLSDEAGHA